MKNNFLKLITYILINICIFNYSYAEDELSFDITEIDIIENGNVISPYDMLPSVHEDMTHEEIETSLSQIENIEDGGAALTAYGKIQYTDMTKGEREKIGTALKRYCELDTLAMVMIYEHLNSIS